MILEYSRMSDSKYAVSIRLMGSSIHQVNTEIPEICHHLTAAIKPRFISIDHQLHQHRCMF